MVNLVGSFISALKALLQIFIRGMHSSGHIGLSVDLIYLNFYAFQTISDAISEEQNDYVF